MPDEKKRHVIILGAGASVSSGYPVANELRLLMSSEKKLRAELYRLGGFNNDYVDKIIAQVIGGPMAKAVDLFRHGGFATVDEFSYLAYHKHAKEVQALKRLLRFTLALHDPEENFEKSDYYYLIQKLFHKRLFPLRQDVAILTFNYDPYLPYLLSKAHKIRCDVSGKQETADAAYGLASGFDSRLIEPLESAEDLCVLQLHGVTAWPGNVKGGNDWCWSDLFGTSLKQRVEKLCFSPTCETPPPVLFPWEVFDQKGEIQGEAEFCFREECDATGYRQGGYRGNVSLHQLFVSIWKRAHKEVQKATKISFVGLSMHEFLNPALKYLLAGRTQNAALVCATKEHIKFRSTDDVEAHSNPRSPTHKLRRLLKEVCQIGRAHV